MAVNFSFRCLWATSVPAGTILEAAIGNTNTVSSLGGEPTVLMILAGKIPFLSRSSGAFTDHRKVSETVIKGAYS